MFLLITGASGSGTTTLGRALAERLRIAHLDADDYFWRPTTTPFTVKRDSTERLSLILDQLRARPSAVVSGSIVNWGAALEDAFDLVVFLYLDAAIRVERLRKREIKLLGKADGEFLDWAAQYDAGLLSGRSLAKHRTWLSSRRCPVLELTGDLTVDERVAAVLKGIAEPDATASARKRAWLSFYVGGDALKTWEN
jgi:hypothetical protein